MKKHLIAAAVAAAVAVPAMAQNVTIGGYMEAGLIQRDNADGSSNLTTNQFQGTSNLRFSVSEDLGGGLKATVIAKTEINPSTGQASNSQSPERGAADAYENYWQEVTVGLSGGFGEVRVGRHDAVARDLGGLYRFMGNIGRVDSTFNPGGDANNQISYTSPKSSGLQVMASRSFGRGDTATGTSNIGAGNGAAQNPQAIDSYMVRYDIGAARLALGNTKTKDAQPVANGTGNTVQGFAGSYDLGFARVGLTAFDRKTAATKVNVRAFNVAAPLMAGLTGQIGFQTYEQKDSANEGEIMAIGLRYDLSKRTAIYATYQTIETGSTGAPTNFDFTRGLNLQNNATAGQKNAGYGLSIGHTF